MNYKFRTFFQKNHETTEYRFLENKFENLK